MAFYSVLCIVQCKILHFLLTLPVSVFEVFSTSFWINFGENLPVLDFRQDGERLIPLMNSHSI